MDGTNGRWYQVNLCAGWSSKNLVRSGPDATLETPIRALKRIICVEVPAYKAALDCAPHQVVNHFMRPTINRVRNPHFE